MTSPATHRVIFTPSGIRAEAAEGQSVYEVALASGVDIQSICGGKGLCRRCQIEVSEGDHAKYGVKVSADHLSGWTDSEEKAAKRGDLKPGRRLACRAQVCGDVVIAVPEDARENRSTISKASTGFTTAHDPAVRLHMCELPEPQLDDNPSDAEALEAALAALGVQARPSHHVLMKLQPLLAKNERALIAVVRDGAEVVDVWPPSQADAYGVAIDIGSTSLALYIYDLTRGDLVHEASAMNPQIRYGEDVMGRVSYIMMNKGGEAALTGEVRGQIAKMLGEACAKLGITAEQVLELVAVGNPIMHHLFWGINPVELGQAPFTLAVKDWFEAPAAGMELGISPAARVATLPLVGGHVGADTTGAYLTQLDRMAGKSALLVDIGTNAEIVLSHNGRVAACSSPTGPAFEGAEISAGVRATPGAIERVRIDRESFQPTVRIIGHDQWLGDAEPEELARHRVPGICGSGIFEVMVELASCGLIDAGGLFRPEMAPHRFVQEGQSWKFLLVDRPENPIWVKQTDVRAVQLAKAALAAGVRLLVDFLDCPAFDEVLLAGAFGTHLDSSYVADIGIIPGASAGQIHSIGNAAGMGAAMCLVNRAEKQRIIDAVRHIEKVETATEPKFQQYFVEAMRFPTAPESGGGEGRRGRRRQR
ncbi:MAG: DUF4445 domain-containing protein [Proteobacteria bacterium]|nr:DUF4445 domain-containing protein [Pseudomonadota bacterium]